MTGRLLPINLHQKEKKSGINTKKLCSIHALNIEPIQLANA
jgi:hypothetical protein